jgi:predicted Zn-dependent protease
VLTESDLKRIADRALAHSTADQTEIVITESESALTRFANNEIHQNVAESDATLLARVVFGKKIGVASINRADEAGARMAIERANELARFQVENPDFRSLPGPAAVAPAAASHQGTVDFTPEDRAWAASAVLRTALNDGLVAAGHFSTDVAQVTVANSLGVFCSHAYTMAQINAVMMSDSSSGFAARTSGNAASIDPEAVAAEAAAKATQGREPQPLEPGSYEVVLESYAVSDLLDFLSYLGFGAQAVQEGRSFMTGRFGQPVLGRNITIWDDGTAADSIPLPFDYEGVPRRRVPLINHGVATGVVYDSFHGGKEGKPSTGHALPAGQTFGPAPLHLHLDPGTASRDDLIRSVKRGVLVTRFWYTRTVHPLTVTVTGMTRDGTFLIEDGRITRPVRNLRFTQSYLDALNRVDLVGSEAALNHEFMGYNRAPALKIAAWEFTGSTEY